MTYQSSPNYPNIFPDQAAHLNLFGVQPLNGNYIHHMEMLPADHEAHPSWREEAHRLAFAKVQNTKDWQHKMLKEHPSIKGFNGTNKRYCFNKNFCTQIAGGRVPEIDDDIQELLKDRITQLNTPGSFSAVAEYRLAPNLKPLDTFQIDMLFSSLVSSVGKGVISEGLISIMSSITNAFLVVGDKLTPQKLGQYSQILAELSRELHTISRRSPLIQTAKNKQIAFYLITALDDLFKLIKRLEAFSGASPTARAMALASERTSVLENARTAQVTQRAPLPSMPPSMIIPDIPRVGGYYY